MLHILYGLVCCEHFVGDEVCYIVKKVENYWSRYSNVITEKSLKTIVHERVLSILRVVL